MQTLIIGIHGKKRSGKDTLCSLIIKHCSKSAYRIAFADELKLEVASACGVDVKFIEDHKDNFRLILQGWGTDFRRNLTDKNYWVNRMSERVHMASKQYNTIIIPDVRFENEYNYIRFNAGILIAIHRNVPAIDTHESERTLAKKFDHVVDNNGDLDSLDKIAEKIVEQYKL